MRSGARRSAGRGRRRILVSSSFEDTRSPLDIEADHERPHKDRRHGPCETCVSGAKEELGSCARRSAGTGRRIVLVAQSFEDQMGPLNAEIGDERPPEDRRLQSRDTCGSGAEEEMASSGRRSAGTGRQIIAVARCFEDTRRPLDVEVGDKRPHKDRRLRPCDSYVSGAMGERVRRARRSVGP